MRRSSSQSLRSLLPAAAQQRDRASIPEKYKWDLTHIYPSNAAWRAAKEKLEGEISSVRSFKGTLGRSPAALADALERVSDLRKTLYSISTYANLQADEDTRQAEHQGMRQEVTLLGFVIRDGGRVHRARDSSDWPRQAAAVRVLGAAPGVAPFLRRGDSSHRGPHAERAGGEDSCQRRHPSRRRRRRPRGCS